MGADEVIGRLTRFVEGQLRKRDFEVATETGTGGLVEIRASRPRGDGFAVMLAPDGGGAKMAIVRSHDAFDRSSWANGFRVPDRRLFNQARGERHHGAFHAALEAEIRLHPPEATEAGLQAALSAFIDRSPDDAPERLASLLLDRMAPSVAAFLAAALLDAAAAAPGP
jgi:hypothetical protein